MRHDNTTSQPAIEYDRNIRKTIPYYDCIHDNVCQWVKALKENPVSWIEAGCGTGTLVEKILCLFPQTNVVASDPSDSMINIAKEKLAAFDRVEFITSGSEALNYPGDSFDVISAVLAHHYFDIPTRIKATENCFRMLRKGGVYITFESVLPLTEQGKKYGLSYWRNAQLSNGKSEADVIKHISRFGIEFFPISIASHLELLHNAGFSDVEICWISGMQAGFYAIK